MLTSYMDASSPYGDFSITILAHRDAVGRGQPPHQVFVPAGRPWRESIQAKLEALDLTMNDVIKMQAYLVAPDGSEMMDVAGFMDGYTKFFGTEDQPNLPTRSVFEVAGLANPLWLVEIEVVAVRP